MSAPGKEFIGLRPLQETRPKSAYFGPAAGLSLLRDNFTISTWLCVGGLVQGSLFWLFGRLSLLPVVAVLLYRALDSYAMIVGFKENTYMKEVIPGKVSAQIPDGTGNYGSKPADTAITVFIIGLRSNHPLGIFAPGMKGAGDHFQALAKNLEETAEEFGFLGMTSWVNSAVRTTASEIQNVCYFRNVEGLHAFAHSPLHREAWDWWNQNFKKQPHLSIYHETYDVPKGAWETIYINSHPSGLATATMKVFDEESGKEMYASPIVDASRGLLKSSAGRMSRSKGMENDKYGEDPYGWQAEKLGTDA